MLRLDAEIIANMRFRAAHCRRLAESIADERTITTLLAMAQEIEADIARLEASQTE